MINSYVCACARALGVCVRVQEAKKKKIAIHKNGPPHLHFYWGATFHNFYRCFHPLSLYLIYMCQMNHSFRIRSIRIKY
jgi:hypothetical protein